MNVYIYVCDVCGKIKEQSVKKKPPICCRKIMRKKYSATPIIYKGKGFYSTDNK